jgi:hypothetical protein
VLFKFGVEESDKGDPDPSLISLFERETIPVVEGIDQCIYRKTVCIERM